MAVTEEWLKSMVKEWYQKEAPDVLKELEEAGKELDSEMIIIHLPGNKLFELILFVLNEL